MANPKYDGVVEAVHYTEDGKVDWVRAYLRIGPTWSDRIIMRRGDLIDEIRKGRKMMVGKRVEYMAGTFDVSAPVEVTGSEGREVLVVGSKSADRDQLEGVPVL